jgi:RNA polymerase sigma-70 factor (ECF subfamily)
MSPDEDRLRRFEGAVLPHLDSAHNLARWLIRSDADAGDVVQEACVRALRYFDGFRGGDAKPWFLSVVRNSAMTWLSRRPPEDSLDEERGAPAEAAGVSSETELLRFDERAVLNHALAALPDEFREAIVLRELEGMSYKDISAALGVPIGTVMSRLSRGRRLLLERLGGKKGGES